MDDKLIPFPKRPRQKQVNYKGLRKTFTRPTIKREHEPILERERVLYPAVESQGMKWYTSRYSGPGEHFREGIVRPLRELVNGPELLIYRVLRDLYGNPDITTIAIPDSASSKNGSLSQQQPLPWEWGYLLKGNSDAIFDIRKQPGTQEPHLAIWVPKLREISAANTAAFQSDLTLLLNELQKTLDQSQYLINNKELKASATSLGPINVYADMLAAGDEQLSAAAALAKRYKSLPLKRENNHPGPSLGTFYLGAAINYLLALEGFVNTISEILRKDEFRAEVFDRATVRADFELRLLSLSLYCIGFSRTPISPNGPAYKRVKQLRAFRNNLLHGNLTSDDHVIHVVPEDWFMFFWWPAADAHRHSEALPFDHLPLSRVLFHKSHAQSVRKYVEATVDLIIEAMDPSYRAWVVGWRHSQQVPAILKQERWVPNLVSVKPT